MAHPALKTGWARTFYPYESLLDCPSEDGNQVTSSPSSRIAGRVLRATVDDTGRTWARVAFGGGVVGWVLRKYLRSVPDVVQLPPALRRQLRRLAAYGGIRSAVVIRDRWGRVLFREGSTKPPVPASVTKLFTVGAALERLRTPALVREILAPSNNRKAQRLLEWIGGGSNGSEARAAERFADGIGAVVDLADGSGLDARNRASADEVVDYLQAMRDHSRYRLFTRGLAVPGRSGTLGDRLRQPSTRGRVQAKSGTLFYPSTSTLAGYLQPRRAASPNRELTFAMLHNGISYHRVRRLQDRMLHLLITRR